MTDKTYGTAHLTIDQMHPTKAEAIAAGHSHYFTRKPCKKRHISPRRVTDGACLECSNIYRKKYVEANKEKIRAQRQRYYQENKERVSQKNKEWYQANKEKEAERDRARYKENPGKKIASVMDYYQKNRVEILKKSENTEGKTKKK